jgi:GT2 family glycosyltransferase
MVHFEDVAAAGTDDRVPEVTVVVVAYGAEPLLVPCVHAALSSVGVVVEVVIVDNGCTDGGVDRVEHDARVRVVDAGANVGFAAGCALGVADARADTVALVNPDAVVQPDALARLVSPLGDPRVGITTASIRLAVDPERVNSAGNEVHVLGYSWCGGLHDAASAHLVARDVASASGAAMALRRATWDELGGFVPEFFTYYEDTELSLRCWQHGRRVVYVPDAVVTHDYVSARNPRKLYLVERNRLVSVCTLYERRTLALLLVPLVVVELAMFAVALGQGWARSKAAGWWWLLRNRRWIRRRRDEVQRTRTVPDAALLDLYSLHIADGNDPLPRVGLLADRALATYLRVVRGVLVRGGQTRATTTNSL